MRKDITINTIASGNILPMSFVKGDTGNSEQVLQAGAGDTPIGVSDTYNRYAGGTAADDGNLAISGEHVGVNDMGAIVPLQCGTTGTWTPYAFLKPDSLGYGTPTTSVADVAGAIALTGATPGQVGRVLVIPPISSGIAAATVTVATLSATLTPSQSGQIIQVTAADKTITLPTGVVGMRYRVIATGTASSGGSTGTIVHVPTGDTLNGQLVTGTAITAASGKGAVNTHATAITGDWIEVVCLAANTWWVMGIQGVWAREA